MKRSMIAAAAAGITADSLSASPGLGLVSIDSATPGIVASGRHLGGDGASARAFPLAMAAAGVLGLLLRRRLPR